MEKFSSLLARAVAAPRVLSADELAVLIGAEEPGEVAALRAAAYGVKVRNSGKVVSLRGLIEAGNVCAKDCFYCGIRKSNANVARFGLSADEILRAAEDVARMRYGSIVIQSGEIESEAHTAFFEDVLRRINGIGVFGITLSLGEQSPDTYRRWREAGANRYLLRIETSDPEIYAKLHPARGHSFARRLACLRSLRECGYQTGTGVMCGLPGQDCASLARDIAFFAAEDIDMIGMGPYIPHRDTPLFDVARFSNTDALRLGLNMISTARLHLHDVNIAATTALQALAADGREQGLLAGANVVMPNTTDVSYRRRYQLYDGKPGLDENSEQSRASLVASIERIGESINRDDPGDSPHYAKRRPL